MAIKVENVSKCYQIYDTPRARLKQFVLPRLRHAIGLSRPQYFREFWALRDVSFEVKKGETVGIIGRNGSGKSTLLQMICGTLNPTSGSIKAHGRISALLELGSGFNPEFTGRENVYMNAAILGVNKDEIDARFDDIAAFADIGDFIEQPVKSYSSGMMVRLAFAVAINVEPEILIVDEALSVGDELFQRKCFSRIEALRAKGATVFFVSHSASQIVELCDRAIMLDGGEIIASGEPKQIVSSYQKLLYAPAHLRDDVRNRLVAGLLIEPGKASESSEGIATEPREAEFDDGFDPNFLPQSTIEFEPRGARIGDLALLTGDDRRVNLLKRRGRYRLRYEVSVDRVITNVRFGMLIKTGSGIPLGGFMSAPTLADAIPLVEPGTRFMVEYSFTCHLNPGVYFMNAGVFGCDGADDGDGDAVLHRKADALVFRVLPLERNCSTEIVDFDFQCVANVNA
ncbi:lipopolysaccharide transport system ATP-binding protein [Neorhizobium galegae]|uniref:ABC transporter ATP-binding protein n=1 Tax=Neorhizobium galegae TaxID=399 RepID=UPI0032AE845E|nr:lipopolysaccharide transport system ATP-binding protein [Neorhizobium galegae]